MTRFVSLDSSPATVIDRMRGSIVAASLGYPEVLHVDVRDRNGGIWHLVSQAAKWSPSDPRQVVGRSIDDVSIDPETGSLRCSFSGGGGLALTPESAVGKEGDPPNWELITPDGIALGFGPGVRWQIDSADH